MANGTIKTGMVFDLLWTNPNPGNAWTTKKILCDNENYDLVSIMFSSDTGAIKTPSGLLFENTPGTNCAISGSIYTAGSYRTITFDTDGITISSRPDGSNNTFIPQRIYGIRI